MAPLSADQHRLTGDLDSPRSQFTAPESPGSPLQRPQSTGELLPDQAPSPQQDKPPEQADEAHRTENLAHRLTGLIRRSTGPLDKTGPLLESPLDQPAHEVDEAFGKKSTSDIPDSAAEAGPPPQRDIEPGEPAKGQMTTNLVRRITGSLKRVTGPLSPPRVEHAPSTAEKPPSKAAGSEGQGAFPPGEAGEKRKRRTGPLGSALPGILRGSTVEEKQASERRQPQPEDYVLEIRHDLAAKEITEPKKPEESGLLKRITSGFKRLTGSLGHTGNIAIPAEKPETAPETESPTESTAPTSAMEAEIEEVLLEDRLSGTAIAEPAAWTEPEDIVIELGPPEPGSFELEEAGEPEGPAESPNLTGEEPISLLESGAIAALNKAEEETQQVEAGTDWMTEIRQEAIEAETQKEAAETEEKGKGIASPLREFITGILHPEEKQLPPAEAEVSDELVTGRLGIDLEKQPGETGAVTTEPAPEVESPLSEEEQAPADIIPLSPAETTSEEEESVTFTPYEPLQTYPDTGQLFTITPEDERLLWGAVPEETTEGAKGPEIAENPPVEAMPPILGPTKPLKRRTTGQLKREEQRKPFEDIRSILLADYMEAEQRGRMPARRPWQPKPKVAKSLRLARQTWEQGWGRAPRCKKSSWWNWCWSSWPSLPQCRSFPTYYCTTTRPWPRRQASFQPTSLTPLELPFPAAGSFSWGGAQW